ncbi:hypothetical protein SAMN04487992_1492, partial [Cellulophaga baltica]
KINTLGLKQANKVMHLSAIAYNLKKHLKFTQKHVKSGAGMGSLFILLKKTLYAVKNSCLSTSKITNYLTN